MTDHGPEAAPVPWEHLRTQPKPLKQVGMLVDLRRCTGCHACSVACKTEHHVPLGGFRIRTRYLERPDRPTLAFLPLLCMHCRDAPCIEACPNNAMVREADGRVVVDKTECLADGACIKSCPYGAIYVDPQEHVADKCDLCRDRTDVGLEPACVNACPTDTLKFVDLEAGGGPEWPVSAGVPLKEHEGTRPAVLYVAPEPWMEERLHSGVQLSEDDDDIIYAQK